MMALPGFWPDDLVDRFEFYLENAQIVRDQNGRDANFLWGANAYLVAIERAGDKRRSELLGKIRELAKQEVAAAQRVEDNFSVATILTILGRSHVASSKHAESTETSRRDLETAEEYFRAALGVAPDDNDAPGLLPWILSLRSDVLAVLVSKYNQRELLDACLNVHERAIQFNNNAERARIRVNFAGILFRAVQWGDKTRQDAARRAIVEAIDDCQQTGVATTLPYLRQLADALANECEMDAADFQHADQSHLAAQHDNDAAELTEIGELACLADLAESPNTSSDFKEAMDIAVDAAQRREFLSKFVEELPDYSADRIEVMRAPLMESDYIRDRIDRGLVDTDPMLAGLSKLEKDALKKTIENDEAVLSEMLEEDRKNNSNEAGKRVIKGFIENGTSFILLLRAFSLETPIQKLPADPSQTHHPNFGDPRIGWRITINPNPERHIFAKVGKILKTAGPILTVANIHDRFPADNINKILISGIGWRRVVFSLAAEAPAILLFLPAMPRDKLPKSLVDEIGAIELLDLKQKSIIVIVKDSEFLSDFEHKDSTNPESTAEAIVAEAIVRTITKQPDTAGIEKHAIELAHYVRSLGFREVYSDQEVIEQSESLLQRITSLLA